MINIKKHIKSTLSSIGYPVYFATNHNATDDTYMVFFIDKTSTFSNCDDEEEAIKHEITLYIYSKADYDSLASEVLTNLLLAGFKRNYEAEDYDSETGYYAKAFKLTYVDYLL